MPAFLLPLLLAGASGLTSALANKSNKSTSESMTKTDSTSTTTPNMDPAQMGIRNYLLANMQSQTENVPDFMENYINTGLRGINQSSNASTNAIRQSMLSRGLGRTSAGLTPEFATENARMGNIANLYTQAPMVQEEIRRNRLGDLSQFFATLPYGQTQTGSSTSTGTGTQTTPNNSLAAGLSGFNQIAALLYGMGAFKGKPNTSGIV